MKPNNLFQFFAITMFAFISSTQQALAWGGRGHDTICESATQLVENKELKKFLTYRPHIMGHLCNVPDIYWKSLSGDQRRHGDTAHFIESDVLGLPLKDLPTNLNEAIEKITQLNTKDNTENASTKLIKSIPLEIGHSWWRTQQLFSLAMNHAKIAVESPLPKNSKEEQNNEMIYNKSIYTMMVTMGIMGHFVGDNSQPFHTTADYDGYEAKHGGIHAYYEEGVVAEFGDDLQYRIIKKAKSFSAKQKEFTKPDNVVEKMKALSLITNSEIKDVYKVDPVKQPSTLVVEKGMKLKQPAVRESTEIGYKKFNNLIVSQMARSAVLLANLWDKLYVEAGKPDLKSYKSYQYPFTPDFIMPDYYEIKESKAEGK